MASSKIEFKDKYVEKEITTGSVLFNQYFYYGEDNSYTSYTCKHAEIVKVEDNSVAILNMLNWTTRVYTFIPNKKVTIRFYL